MHKKLISKTFFKSNLKKVKYKTQIEAQWIWKFFFVCLENFSIEKFNLKNKKLILLFLLVNLIFKEKK